MTSPNSNLDIRTLYLKDLSLFGCTVLQENVFKHLIDHIEAEKIRPVVSKTFPLKEIVQVKGHFQTKQHTGKLVINMSMML